MSLGFHPRPPFSQSAQASIAELMEALKERVPASAIAPPSKDKGKLVDDEEGDGATPKKANPEPGEEPAKAELVVREPKPGEAAAEGKE